MTVRLVADVSLMSVPRNLGVRESRALSASALAPGARAGRVARVSGGATFRLPGRAGEPGPDRIGLGLAALGRPGYLNLGHGEDLGRRALGRRRCAAHARGARCRLRGRRALLRRRALVRPRRGVPRQWLRDRDPPDVVVGSKWGYVYTAGWEVDADPPEVKHHDAATPCAASSHETRKHLGDRLALYQIHSATLESGVLDRRRRWSPSSPRCAARASRSACRVSGGSQPETIEARGRALGAVRRRPGDLEPARDLGRATRCGRRTSAGWRVIVKEALANGRLTARARRPAARSAAARRRRAAADALALAAVLARPWADVVLSGAATDRHAEQQLAAAEVQVERRAWRGAPGGLSEESSDYWSARSDMAWN